MSAFKGVFRKHPFWRGVGNTLVLCPHCHQTHEPYLRDGAIFRGNKIFETKSEDALASDWKNVGLSIAAVIQKQEEDELVRR